MAKRLVLYWEMGAKSEFCERRIRVSNGRECKQVICMDETESPECYTQTCNVVLDRSLCEG